MQYFDKIPESQSQPVLTKAIVKNTPFQFWTDHGVFSKKGLDFGSRALLENLPYSQLHGKILDLGCGYGAIGIVIQKITGVMVVMSDVNQRALSLTKKNILQNGVSAHVMESDCYQNIIDLYDYIVTNPPIRVGNKILYELLIGAKKHLKPNGELWFVIAKDQGAKTVIKRLQNEYQVSVIKKEKGFYIICAKNSFD